jgi:hypothetical protein
MENCLQFCCTQRKLSPLSNIHSNSPTPISSLSQLPSDETLTILDTVMIGVLSRARIFKLLRSPRIDSKEPIPPDCVACGGPVRQPYSGILRLDFASSSSFSIRRCFLFVHHCKKRLAVFPSPAGMSFIKLSLDGNNLVFLQCRSSIAADISGAWVSKKPSVIFYFTISSVLMASIIFKRFILYYSIYK